VETDPSPVVFSPEQAVAIAAAIAAHPAGPYASQALDALETILGTLDPASEHEVAVALSATARAGRGAMELSIERAFAERLVMIIEYTDRRGQTSTDRPVEPHALAVVGGVKYLLAWCRLRGGPRWFRYDRVARVVVTAEPVVEDRDIVALFAAGSSETSPTAARSARSATSPAATSPAATSASAP
jgi:predicted DNA-binding transcriptional regulator YafY